MDDYWFGHYLASCAVCGVEEDFTVMASHPIPNDALGVWIDDVLGAAGWLLDSAGVDVCYRRSCRESEAAPIDYADGSATTGPVTEEDVANRERENCE